MAIGLAALLTAIFSGIGAAAGIAGSAVSGAAAGKQQEQIAIADQQRKTPVAATAGGGGDPLAPAGSMARKTRSVIV